MKRDRSSKKRRQLARAVERAAVLERPCARAPRYLVQPYVTTACAASLQAIAAALRNETLVLGEDELRSVKAFILDGRSRSSVVMQPRPSTKRFASSTCCSRPGRPSRRNSSTNRRTSGLPVPR